jgi:hypothetical protein
VPRLQVVRRARAARDLLRRRSGVPESTFVFNIVWTGGTFRYLRYFVSSLLANSDARFRFLLNGCTPESTAMMRRFAEHHAGRVVGVVETSATMEAHGIALDAAYHEFDDGDFFCFVDPDILATGPFVGAFAERLSGSCDAVSSGRGVWAETDVVPVGHKGVNGEYFFSSTGYVFGSPHFAMYRRSPLDATRQRWGIRFASAGPDLSDAAKEQLARAGHDYIVYDTGKIVNILLQEDGGTLCHFEHPSVMHIGGMSHYLSPPKYVVHEEGGEPEPDWSRWKGMATRYEVARFTGAVLRALTDGEPPPGIPDGVGGDLVPRLERVRSELVDLVGTYGGPRWCPPED